MAGSPVKRARRQAAHANDHTGSVPIHPSDILVVPEEVGDEDTDVAIAVPGDARAFLRGTVDDQIEKLAEYLLENAKAKKKYRANCPGCKRNVLIEIPDAKASTDAIDKLIALGYGRQTGDSKKHEGFVLERRIVRPDEEKVLEEALKDE